MTTQCEGNSLNRDISFTSIRGRKKQKSKEFPLPFPKNNIDQQFCIALSIQTCTPNVNALCPILFEFYSLTARQTDELRKVIAYQVLIEESTLQMRYLDHVYV